MSEDQTVRRRRSEQEKKRPVLFFSMKAPFPLKTVIVLSLLLILSILLLGLMKGNLRQLEQEREREAAAYETLVNRHTVRYRDWIEKYAAENNIHPAFVAAIILR